MSFSYKSHAVIYYQMTNSCEEVMEHQMTFLYQQTLTIVLSNIHISTNKTKLVSMK